MQTTDFQSAPWRLAARQTPDEPTVVYVGGRAIGGGSLTLIAGPCSVESECQIVTVARQVKAAGASLLRGGAFKPRTSPYAFQGRGAEGLRLLSLAKRETGLPIVTELTELAQLSHFDDVDLIQIGARNMQNFALLRELGRQRRPVLLKRGMAATYEELLMSAEYILAEGNEQVILCERGIRSFEPYTRCTLDLTAVPALHSLSRLPVLVDPSHAAGRASLVPALSRAAAAAGADGLLIEVHNDPPHALSDGEQALSAAQFSALAPELQKIHQLL